MGRINFKPALHLILVLLFTFCITQSTAAQNTKEADDKQVLQSLLSEVTMLRQAMQTMQRMSVDTFRSQLLVERVRLQREDVQAMTSALDETRDSLEKTARTIPSFIDRQKVMETYIQQETDAFKRAKVELELKQNKESVENYKIQLERLRTREQEMASQLQLGKNKLEELEGRLDLLERSIENDRERMLAEKPTAAPKPAPKP